MESSRPRRTGAALADRRLRLDQHPPAVRAISIAAIAAWAIAGVLVLMLGLKIGIPGGAESFPDDANGVPVFPATSRVVLIVAFLGLAAAAAALTSASHIPGWRFGLPVRLLVALVGAGFAGETIEAGKALATYHGLGMQVHLHFIPKALPTLIQVAGWVGLAAALLTAIAPGAIRRRTGVAAAVASTPYLLALLAYVATLVLTDTPPSPLIDASSVAVENTIAVVTGASFFVAALLLWQAVVGARAARDFGNQTAHLHNRVPLILEVFVVAKLAWLALGYLDL